MRGWEEGLEASFEDLSGVHRVICLKLKLEPRSAAVEKVSDSFRCRQACVLGWTCARSYEIEEGPRIGTSKKFSLEDRRAPAYPLLGSRRKSSSALMSPGPKWHDWYDWHAGCGRYEQVGRGEVSPCAYGQPSYLSCSKGLSCLSCLWCLGLWSSALAQSRNFVGHLLFREILLAT